VYGWGKKKKEECAYAAGERKGKGEKHMGKGRIRSSSSQNQGGKVFLEGITKEGAKAWWGPPQKETKKKKRGFPSGETEWKLYISRKQGP